MSSTGSESKASAAQAKTPGVATRPKDTDDVSLKIKEIQEAYDSTKEEGNVESEAILFAQETVVNRLDQSVIEAIKKSRSTIRMETEERVVLGFFEAMATQCADPERKRRWDTLAQKFK